MERSPFLTATAKHEGIATLEADDGLAVLSQLDEESIDFFLSQRVVVSCFADVDNFCITAGKAQELGVCQMIGDNRIGFFQEFFTAQR